ncbi:BZ3500_MvSof-1268-A1-R1_Chr2-2g05131 [Microbotryum saponariae]|uniref:Serine/threonine-protein phosphatase 2A activator n=1 Tax=Microbotryum saponariae TaxID=289078 RepID=A0A2X0M9G7_9BASI|nr:BZ3500_MvSof-1268-A1-R1_Chr2-2g05131 [Microbotryum saponariae]SDA00958.1 BZ3501_MvSof-1269-A2-R1_Chr2-2g04805 [Microbotryum saponariae]
MSNMSTSSPVRSTLPTLELITDLSVSNGSSVAPSRKIFTEVDMPCWTRSSAYHNIEALILRLTAAPIASIVEFLNRSASWVDEIPLEKSPQRFGNQAFRKWLAKLKEQHEPALSKSLLSDAQMPVLAELSYHFLSSFGSGQRLDYGTGHELSFLFYILILRLIGVLSEDHEPSIVLDLFVAYLGVVRKLQKVYRLEPAGSKGVWGLDDHQHLNYLWGASQLQAHPTLRPSSILTPSTIEPEAPSYLFLSSILHVNQLKRGPFSEHSPMLHTIASTVPNWGKVVQGLLKMYKVEVMGKVPVVQHVRFGRVLSWTDWETGVVLESSRSGEEGIDGEGEGEEGEAEGEEKDQGTKAPWLLASASSGDKVTLIPPPPTHTTSRASLGFSRQQPMSYTQSPRSFAPPALFPTRREPSSSLGRGEDDPSTVAQDGGAAASTSPFGILPSVTRR